MQKGASEPGMICRFSYVSRAGKFNGLGHGAARWGDGDGVVITPQHTNALWQQARERLETIRETSGNIGVSIYLPYTRIDGSLKRCKGTDANLLRCPDDARTSFDSFRALRESQERD